MTDIPTLLKMLQSNDANKRYEACEELRVSPSLSPEALEALRVVTNDPNPDVADAAQRAIKLHSPNKDTLQSNSSREEVQLPITPIPFWENPSAKLKALLVLYGLEFIFTLPWSIYPGALLYFPVGLFFWIPNSFSDNSPYTGVGWLLYTGISIAIMASSNKNLVRVLFIVLAVMLVFNAGGCHMITSNLTP